jgi:hypothetical protein
MSTAWTTWRKSSYSGGTGTGNCVEVAMTSEAVGVRDSKNLSGPTLAFDTTQWREFLGSVA